MYAFLLLALQALPPAAAAAAVREATLAVEGDSVARVAARFRARLVRDSADRAALVGLASLARLTYDYATAEQRYAQLRPVQDRAGDEIALQYALGRGLMYLTRSRPHEALSHFRDAARIAREIRRPEIETEALVGLAAAAAGVDDRKQWKAALERAARTGRTVGGHASAAYHCAEAEWRQSQRLKGAKDAARRGAELAQRAGEPRLEALCLIALARDYYYADGDVSSAGPHLLKAAMLQRSAHDRAALGATLLLTGQILVSVRNYGLAHQYLNDALSEGEAAGVPRVTAGARVGLGRLAFLLGDHQRAHELAVAAEDELKVLGATPEVADAQQLRGELAVALGRFSDAREDFAKVKAAALRSNSLQARLGAHRLAAALATREQNWDSAAAELDAALSVVQVNAMTGWEPGLQRDIAVLALRRGDVSAATTALERSLGRREQPLARYEIEILWAEIFARSGEMDSAEANLLSSGEILDRWRAGLSASNLRLLAYQARGRLGQAGFGEATVTARRAAAGRLGVGFRAAEQRRARELFDRLSAAELASGAKDTAAIVRRRARVPEGGISLTEVQAGIPDDSTALLAYVTGRDGQPTTVFVLTRRAATARVLAPLDSLALAIERFTGLLESGTDAREAARHLGDALLTPAVSALPASIVRLVIVADDVLHHVPFEALVLADGQVALQRFAISEVPSAAVAIALWKRPVATRTMRILALGDPVFGSAAGAPDEFAASHRDAFAGTDGLARLPGSAAEARRAARYAGQSEVRLRERASESFLKGEPLDSFRVLHFATHALVDDGSVARTALALAPGEGDDGFLGPNDLAALRLDADLVVLSGCRSARGPVIRGQGVQGLVAPLLLAGARSVVATRWRIGDRDAGRFVDRFYRELAGGRPVADALRHAKLAAFTAGESPAQWAAFTAIGDPLVTIPLRKPLPLPSTAWLVGGAMLLAVAGAAAWFRRRAA